MPLLDTRVRMRVPPGTQSGAVFRIRGKGLLRSNGARGDAHVRIVVEIPATVPDEARPLLERLASAVDDAAYPRRQAFREACREDPAPAAAPERQSG